MAEQYEKGFAGLGWGLAIPDSRLSSEKLEARLGLTKGWIKRRTGIESRPVADPHLATSDLAVEAASQALESANLPPGSIRLLILATSTPDYPLPPTAPSVAQELGLEGVGAIDLAGACSGFLYGLTLADSFCRIHGGAALVIGANILTRRLNWQDPATASLFSDGAGAVVWGSVTRPAGLRGVHLDSDATDVAQVMVPEGGTKEPYGPGTFSRNGHLMTMNAGPRLFRKAVAAMVGSGKAALARANLTAADIDVWIPHQANLRLIEEVGRQLQIPPEKTLIEVETLGNASAATIPMVWALKETRQKTKPGQQLLMTSVGAGLISAGCVIRH